MKILLIISFVLMVGCSEVKQSIDWDNTIVQIDKDLKKPLDQSYRKKLIDTLIKDEKTKKSYHDFIKTDKGAKAFDDLITRKVSNYKAQQMFKKDPSKVNRQRLILSDTLGLGKKFNKTWNEVFN